MANEENIKRYTREELQAMRERGEDQTDWAKIDALTDADIEAAIASDPDEAGIEWDWDSAKLVLAEPKAHVNLRLDADVVRFFKSQGKGYQTRINAVLRTYVDAQKSPKSKRVRHKQPQ